MNNMLTFISAFMEGWHSGIHRKHFKREKNIRNRMKDQALDSMLENSFPASDPPSTY